MTRDILLNRLIIFIFFCISGNKVCVREGRQLVRRHIHQVTGTTDYSHFTERCVFSPKNMAEGITVQEMRENDT